jgi:hypothetical protein
MYKAIPQFQILCIFFYFLNYTHTKLSAQCIPQLNLVYGITSDSVKISAQCCNQGTYYLEYGPAGFIPGIDSLVGQGDSVIQVISGTTSLTGLLPDTYYACYLRIMCLSGGWSGNDSIFFRTAPNCLTAPVVMCNNIVQVSSMAGVGAWNPGCFQSVGRENIFRFTPIHTGLHNLITGHTTLPSTYHSILYKEASSGCNNTGWNCLGYLSSGIQQYSFGPLTAGITYIIRIDWGTAVSDSGFFKIECPYCPQISGVYVSDVGPTTATVNFNLPSGFVTYGPSNFIPGGFYPPGTVFSMGIFNGGIIYNLEPNTFYDLYVRDCPNGPNSQRIVFSTPGCPTPVLYDSLESTLSVAVNIFNPSYYDLCLSVASSEEPRILFNAPESGSYYLITEHPTPSLNAFAMKEYDNTCNTLDYNCMYGTTSNGKTYTYLLPLDTGITYDILIDHIDSLPQTVNFKVLCPRATNIEVSSIFSSQAVVRWDCPNCHDSVFVEYGLNGFQPGANYNPSAQGNLIVTLDDSVHLTGLIPFTEYDVYVRTICGGYFSTNSTTVTFKTSKDCAASLSIQCGNFINYHYAGMAAVEQGAWTINACSNNDDSEEMLYEFIAPDSGMYSLIVYGLNSNWIYYGYELNILYKSAALPCDANNWNCIANITASLNSFSPQTYNFGPLIAGEPYYIMFDNSSFPGIYYYTYNLYLKCPGDCPAPHITNLSDVTPSSVQVNVPCELCYVNGFLEYGLTGFIPGVDSLPGGGTLINNVDFPYVINGLDTGETYDVYARANCDSSSTSFSINYGPLTFTTCATAPTGIINNLPGNFICNGDSAWLYRVGGIPVQGVVYKWYINSCGGTSIGTGDSIKVTPSISTIYYLRAEAPCGITHCISHVIYVTNPNITFSGDTVFCQGDSSIISVDQPSVYYLWSTGETTQAITIVNSGIYYVTITNGNGCTDMDSIWINEIVPTANITASGPTTFCQGDSVELNCNAGPLSFQWFKNGLVLPGQTSAILSIQQAGNYNCIASYFAGCSDTSNIIRVNIPCIDLNEPSYKSVNAGMPEKIGITVNPNPSTGDFNINVSGEHSNRVFIEIIDAKGSSIPYNIEYSEDGFILRKMHQGVYAIRLFTKDWQESIRIVQLE